MAKRPSLAGQVKAPQTKAAEAAEIARNLTAKPETMGASEDRPTETISYNLPLDLIDLVRAVATERLRIAREVKRQAKREGREAPEARMSASAVIRDALDAQREALEAELRGLRANSRP